MPRFSANLSFLYGELPFLDRFAAAARDGFLAVEFAFGYDFAAREIAARLDAHGLLQVLINAPPGEFAAGDRGLAAVPGREHEFAASVATALRYAQALACPRVHVMAGVLPADPDERTRSRYRSTFVANLRLAAREAEEQGVELTIEPINTRDVPGYFLNTQAEAHAIREETGAPNLKVQMDLYHAQIVEGDLTEKLRRWLPHIGHVQIAGVPGRHEPDVGEINYAYLFALLDELDYKGWIGCEYRPRAGTSDGLAWIRNLAVALRSPGGAARIPDGCPLSRYPSFAGACPGLDPGAQPRLQRRLLERTRDVRSGGSAAGADSPDARPPLALLADPPSLLTAPRSSRRRS